MSDDNKVVAEWAGLDYLAACPDCGGLGDRSKWDTEYDLDDGCPRCESTGTITVIPDLTIYENLTPVLDKLKHKHDIWWANNGAYIFFTKRFKGSFIRGTLDNPNSTNNDLPTTLRDMVAEMIRKGEV